jgi:hypothetical protein
MSLISALFTSRPVAPKHIPTDTVIPLNAHDDQQHFRGLTLDFSMRFDDALDVAKLVGALEKLIEKPGWRKLGARLRLNVRAPLQAFELS